MLFLFDSVDPFSLLILFYSIDLCCSCLTLLFLFVSVVPFDSVVPVNFSCSCSTLLFVFDSVIPV